MAAKKDKIIVARVSEDVLFALKENADRAQRTLSNYVFTVLQAHVSRNRAGGKARGRVAG